MSLRTVFTENLKFYRKKAGLSQQVLAEKCGIATNYLSEIEREQKFPSIETIDKLINVAIENEQHQTYLLLIKYKYKKYATPAKQLSL